MRTHTQRVDRLKAQLLEQVASDYITPAQYYLKMSRVDAVAARQISTPERQHIFDEAGGMCEYCREQPARRVDHVVPVSKGGTSDRENLKAACVPCNDDKFDDTPEQWRERRLAVGLSWPPDWSADLRAMLEDQGLLPSQREGTLRQSKAV